MWLEKTHMMNNSTLINSLYPELPGLVTPSLYKELFYLSLLRILLSSQLMFRREAIKRRHPTLSNFHTYLNLCSCPHWPPFTVDGLSMHLPKASPSSWVSDLSYLPPQELTPAIASFSPAPSLFPVYSPTRCFPSAYKHAVSFHILKKEPRLTHTSSCCHSISQIFFIEKLSEQINCLYVFLQFLSFHSLLKSLQSVFCPQYSIQTNPVKVTPNYLQLLVHWSALSPHLTWRISSTWHSHYFLLIEIFSFFGFKASYLPAFPLISTATPPYPLMLSSHFP